MTSLREIFSMLALPASAISIATGDIPLPFGMIPGIQCRFYRPPALVPIWGNSGDSFLYYGLWKHWLVPSRAISFVRYHVGDGMITEEGRTFEQMLEFYSVWRLGVGPDQEEAEFLRAVGLHELQPVVGRGVKILLERKAFEAGLPQKLAGLCDLPYTGDFPHVVDGVSSVPYRHMCDIEVPEKLPRAELASASSPPWLRSSDQQPIFEELLSQLDYSAAWLSLNSSDWETKQAASALLRLANAVNERSFSAYAEYWAASVPEDCTDGY